MGVLDAVLQYKATKEAQQQQDIQAIPQAIVLFNRAKESAQENRLKELAFRGDLAVKGIKLNADNTFSRDESMMSETDKLIEKGKVATAQRAIYDAGGPAPSGFGQSANPQGQQGKIVAEDYDQFGRPKSFKDIGAQQQIKDAEPLAADSATRFSGAQQGMQNVNDIVNQINTHKGNRKDLIYQANLAIEAENAKDTIIPGAKALYKVSKLTRTSDQSKQLANSFSTLSENLLRARTGATAPDPEIVREYARTLLKTFQESPTTWNQKLQNDFNFLKTTHDELRPLRSSETGDFTPINQNDNSTDVYPTNGLQNQMVRKYLTANKSAIDFLTLGNSNRVADLAGKMGADPTAVNVYKNLETKDPIESLIRMAPTAVAATQLVRLGGQALMAKAASNNAAKLASQLEPTVQRAAEQAQVTLSALKPEEGLNKLIPVARNNIKENYVAKQYEIYGKKLDQIKGNATPITEPASVIDNLALKTNSATGNFETAQIAKVYKGLNDKMKSGKAITEADIVDGIKTLKGTYGGKVNAAKYANYEAANELSESLTGANADILKGANIGYRQFKTNYKNIDDLIGLDERKIVLSKNNDAVVKSLLNNDLGQNQQGTLQLIGDVSGIKDFPNVVTKYRGLIQTANAPMHSMLRPIVQAGQGVKKMLVGSPASGSKVSNEVKDTLNSLKGSGNKYKMEKIMNRQEIKNQNTLKSLQKQEIAATKDPTKQLRETKAKQLKEEYIKYKNNPSKFKSSIKKGAERSRKAK